MVTLEDAADGGARVPTQRRSRERQDALLRAALELIAEGGTRAVTHRAVAARAGLPLAATTYYFESISDLTVQALRLHVRERIDQLQTLADQAAREARSRQDIGELITESLVGRDSGAIIAQFEVYLEAARNPDLRPAVIEALDVFERLAATILAAIGARAPDASAAAFVAVINGFALRRVARHSEPHDDAESLVAALRALVIEQLMPEAELERWKRRFDQPLNS